MAAEPDSSRPQRQSDGGLTASAWLIVGGVVFLGLALLAVRPLYQSSETPALDFVVTDVRPEDGHFHVTIMTHNEGASLASPVRIHGELHIGGITEVAETTLPYLSGRSKAWSSLHFQHDPRAQPLTLFMVP